MLANSLLWALRHPDSPHSPSYLFGTMHVQDARVFGHLAALQTLIRRCEIFALEYDLDESAPSLSPFSLPAQALPLYSEREARRLGRILRNAFGLDFAQVKGLPPLFLLRQLSENAFALDYPEALDATLWAYAKAQGRHIVGLESLEAQMAILLRIPPQDQKASLLRSLGQVPRFRARLRDMLRAYEAGDIGKLYQQARDSLGKERRSLLFERNAHMAGQLAQVAQQHSVFCAVGAAHLAGGKGMLRLLKKAGFELHPLALADVLPDSTR